MISLSNGMVASLICAVVYVRRGRQATSSPAGCARTDDFARMPLPMCPLKKGMARFAISFFAHSNEGDHRTGQSMGGLVPVSRSCISIHFPSTSRLII